MKSVKRGIGELSILDFAFQTIRRDELRRLEQTKSWSKALVVPSTLSAVTAAQLFDLNHMKLVITVRTWSGQFEEPLAGGGRDL